ncbi:unnamed protein product [Paramecium pentaurelia]|uniref:Uncharacterized protein n=1 Tax=Paramecium pentaurelia TaxID=43138 RepID=A0A8S1XB50_9CILI|nr:unnamed protein product [Paramecium pentaurelia]
MNEQKLREMMKIYTVSKQVNKKAEKNFIKFSSQYYKLHKNDMTPDLLNEVNSLRTQIKSDRVAFSNQNSPQVSPRLTTNPLFNFKEEKPKLNSIYSDDKHQDIYKLYIEEISDLKSQLNQANSIIKQQKIDYDRKILELNLKLESERARIKDLNQQIQEMKSNQLTKSIVPMLNYSFDQKKQKQNSDLNKEQSRELFKTEICKALEKYNNNKQDQSKEYK